MSNPKSILLHIDGSSRVAQRVQVARDIADRFGAQVTALHSVIPSMMRLPFMLEGTAATVAALMDLDRTAQIRAREAFDAARAGSPRLHWAQSRGNGPAQFVHESLYADLLVLGQHDPEGATNAELPVDFVASTLVDSGRPALVVPYAGPVGMVGRRILIAWKESREAARAVSAAIPWMLHAEQVDLVCFDDDPAIALQALRARLAVHGIAANLHPSSLGNERLRDEPGGRLLSLAADLATDLLVMGCYGHSRTREWVLGGATRTILQSMTVPVLMVH